MKDQDREEAVRPALRLQNTILDQAARFPGSSQDRKHVARAVKRKCLARGLALRRRMNEHF